MSKIVSVRPILLSAPYAHPENLEVQLHLPSGHRTCGLVEITVENGETGLGECYLPVYAPNVFKSLIELITPVLIGRSVFEVNKIYNDLCVQTGWWSMQGAARHAISAIEIALQDCRAKLLGVPVYKMLGGSHNDSIQLYGSGGDSAHPDAMEKEFDQLEKLGIGIFKIRARKEQIHKTAYCLQTGAERRIEIAVDMTQNLANPPQPVADAVQFVETVEAVSGRKIYFLEEALGPSDVNSFRMLRKKINTKVAGGESITTPKELSQRVELGTYDIVQPDTTVCGGIGPVLDVFTSAHRHSCEVVVHCWGGPVGMMANYHAAFAGGGKLAEWPMPYFPLREELMVEPWDIEDGRLTLPDVPGLGVYLPSDIEEKYPFREEAVYTCLVDQKKVSSDEAWQEYI